nr:GNAT family N-acetyltransferase [Pontibacter liquoris]
MRALEPDDLDFLYALENDTAVWHIGNTVAPYAKYVLAQYLQNAGQDIYTARQLRFVICSKSHQAVGAIDIFDFEPLHQRAGIGIVIDGPHRGNGHAAEALDLLLHYCRHTLQLHQVYCTVTAGNTASIKLFQKCGFAEVGVRRDWLKTPEGWEDAHEFQRLL